MRSRTLRSQLLLCEAQQHQIARRLRTLEGYRQSVLARQQGDQQAGARGSGSRPYFLPLSRLQQQRKALLQRCAQLQQEAAATQQLLEVLQKEEQHAAAAASASAAALLRPNTTEEGDGVAAARQAGDKQPRPFLWNIREADKAEEILLFLRSKLLAMLQQLLLFSDRRSATCLKREAAAMHCMQPLPLPILYGTVTVGAAGAAVAGAATARTAAAGAAEDDMDTEAATADERVAAAAAAPDLSGAAATGARRVEREAAASLAAAGRSFVSAAEGSRIRTTDGDGESELAQQQRQAWGRSEEYFLPSPGGPLGPASFFSVVSQMDVESNASTKGDACVLLRQALAAADDWRNL